MIDAEQAVHAASASLPEHVRARLETAEPLTAEDRTLVIETARTALARFQPVATTPETPSALES
jgi:hypothetical protein